MQSRVVILILESKTKCLETNTMMENLKVIIDNSFDVVIITKAKWMSLLL